MPSGNKPLYLKKLTPLSKVSQPQSYFSAAPSAASVAEEIDALAAGLQVLAPTIDQQSELVNHILDLAVADILLQDDIGDKLKKGVGRSH